jgi:hypothetical protein
MLFGMLLFSYYSYGKTLPESTKQKLIKNGVKIINEENTYTEHQYYLLQSFDFMSYRNYTTRRIVQIEDGPLVELYSLTEIQQQGQQIPNEYLLNKKDEIINPNLQKIITLINIGFRYGPILNTETGF